MKLVAGRTPARAASPGQRSQHRAERRSHPQQRHERKGANGGEHPRPRARARVRPRTLPASGTSAPGQGRVVRLVRRPCPARAPVYHPLFRGAPHRWAARPRWRALAGALAGAGLVLAGSRWRAVLRAIPPFRPLGRPSPHAKDDSGFLNNARFTQEHGGNKCGRASGSTSPANFVAAR